MITDNPIFDAQDHFRKMDEREPEYKHICSSCEEGFFEGSIFGKYTEEKFCKNCIADFRHIDFYKNLDLSDRTIYEILKEEIKLYH